MIAREMDLLGWEINSFESFLCFRRRQSFLAARDGSLQRSLEGAIDPHCEIELMLIRGFEQKNPFQQDDVDVSKAIAMLAMNGRLCIAAIGDKIDTPTLFQRQHESLKHFVETQRVFVKVFGWIIAIDADVRQIQPIVG